MNAQKLKNLLKISWWKNRISKRFFDAKIKSELRLLQKFHEGQEVNFLPIQNKKLSSILNYADKFCPFYTKTFKKCRLNPDTLENFNKIPLLDKQIIKENLKEIITSQIDKIHHRTANTGGSTGEPLEFPVNPHADKHHQEFLYKLMGYKKGDAIAAFDGVTVPENFRQKNIYWIDTNPFDIPYGRRSYSSLYLNKETIPYYIRSIKEMEPSIFRGYPSFISHLAHYIVENKIQIPFTIKGVELTAEAASPDQIEIIKKAFQTRVYFQYGHSEVSVFGYTIDESYEYFCSPFYGLTEILDPDGKHVRQGEIGEITVTGFYNKALPFIRYKTGDMAEFKTNENGMVTLKKITGRTQDFIYTSKKEPIALTALVFGCHYKAFANITKWQIEQNAPGKVDIRITKGINFSEKDESEIRDNFYEICGIETNFIYTDSMALTPRGKSKFLIQNL